MSVPDTLIASGNTVVPLPAEAPCQGLSEGNAACNQRHTALEQEVIRQRRLLLLAKEYLHEAAYLARYHQPALERHIRALLDELKS